MRLPELPGAADLSTLISDTSRMRLWYDGPEQWRTRPALLRRRAGSLRDARWASWTWDSGTHRTASCRATTQLRLPIPHRPHATRPGPAHPRRRHPEEITAIRPSGWPGQDGDGLRIVPASPSVDHREGRPVGRPGRPASRSRVEVTAKGRDHPSLETGFLDLEHGGARSGSGDVRAAARVREERSDDRRPRPRPGHRALLRRPRCPTRWPAWPAGPRWPPAPPRTATGFDVVGVLALPEQFVTDTLRTLPVSQRPWGHTAAVVTTPLVNGMIFVAARHGLHRRRARSP